VKAADLFADAGIVVVVWF